MSVSEAVIGENSRLFWFDFGKRPREGKSIALQSEIAGSSRCGAPIQVRDSQAEIGEAG